MAGTAVDVCNTGSLTFPERGRAGGGCRGASRFGPGWYACGGKLRTEGEDLNSSGYPTSGPEVFGCETAGFTTNKKQASEHATQGNVLADIWSPSYGTAPILPGVRMHDKLTSDNVGTARCAFQHLRTNKRT